MPHLDKAAPSCSLQGRRTAAGLSSDVSACSEKLLSDVKVSSCGCIVQRSRVAQSARIHQSASRNEHIHNFRMAISCCLLKGSHSAVRLRVHLHMQARLFSICQVPQQHTTASALLLNAAREAQTGLFCKSAISSGIARLNPEL